MILQEKITKIISAIKLGVSIYKLDPIGKGTSAKLLLQGKMPTQKKILEMYANLLIHEKEVLLNSQNNPPSSPADNSDIIIHEKLRLKKIQVIIEAANAGVPHSYIDPLGGGNSVRRLLNGGTPKTQKIDSMYDNVIQYQQKQLLEKREQFIILNPHDNPDNDIKKQRILSAVQSGIQKCKIDTAGGGKAITRLQEGQSVLQITLDMMYSNLLALLGYSQETQDPSSPEFPSARQSYSSLQNQISSLQNVVASLVDRTTFLETAFSIMQQEIQPSKKHTTHKILGATLMLKDDHVRGKVYRRWYALYHDRHNKRRWIYVGVHLNKAKDKILAWFERHPLDVCNPTS